MIIIITEIKVKNFWKYPAFLKHTMRAFKQAKLQEGNLHSSINAKGMSGFTITAWRTKDNMLQFKNSGNHKIAMKQISKLSSGYKTLVYESEQTPEWNEALTLLKNTDYKKASR